MEKLFSENKITVLDGAMGTMLQKSGLRLGERPELLCLSNPDVIENIHRQYVASGAEIIYTNTFGANRLKLKGTNKSPEEIISSAVKIGRNAVKGTKARVALDIGPLGELLEPNGTLSFESAYDCFKEMVLAGERAGANLIVLETMTDLYELKAAVLASKENTSLPVMVSMTFEENGRTFTGAEIEASAITLEGLGVDAIGINCSLGPEEIFPFAKRLCEITTKPCFVKPNAGLPDPETGVYQISPKDFAKSLKKYADIGVFAVGGCCGTTPEYIKEIKEIFSGINPQKIDSPLKEKSAVTSATKTVFIDDIAVIGERINPTGKKLMREALLNGDMAYILRQAVTQADAGAKILDVNVGAPGIDEKEVLPKVVKAIQSVTDLPLQLDSSDTLALERALRVYNGKAIINSVNGKDEVLDEILPIAKKYGAAVVGLTLDENGIPHKAEERLKIAEKILKKSESYGIKKENIFIDCLTLTVSAQQEDAAETLKALKMVKENLGLKTVLGVSNISFGLPNRELLNHSFLLMAMENGLNMPIINPNIDSMMDCIRAFRVLKNRDKQSAQYIDAYKDYVSPEKQKAKISPIETLSSKTKDEKSSHPLTEAIKKGLSDEAKKITEQMLFQEEPKILPMEIVDGILIPALDMVGELFEKGRLFLPQLLQSANAAQSAFCEIKKSLSKSKNPNQEKGPIILATVKGDIHDIGKNIVKVILENYGYKVLDLGRDVPPEEILKKVIETKAPLVGLSALMTTTLKSMEETISLLKSKNLPCKIMVGGAVLTSDYAMKIGADFYAKDAKESADIAKKVIL